MKAHSIPRPILFKPIMKIESDIICFCWQSNYNFHVEHTNLVSKLNFVSSQHLALPRSMKITAGSNPEIVAWLRRISYSTEPTQFEHSNNQFFFC